MGLEPQTLKISTWDELENAIDSFAGAEPYTWIFRGQREAHWRLCPRIERECAHSSIKESEEGFLRDFSSRAHLYSAHVPRPDDRAAWLSAMQHHGVPTRLLDWTYSPYIALFFAAETVPQGDCFSLWGAHVEGLAAVSRKRADDWFGISGDLESPANFSTLAFGPYFVPNSPQGLVISIVPQFHVSRLSSQQGCFLFNCNPWISFEESLAEMMTTTKLPIWLFRLDFPKDLRTSVLKRLMQMNIHPATLFPDLEGLARFLALKNMLFHRDSHARPLLL